MIWYSFVEILKLVYFGMVWYDLVWFGQNSEAVLIWYGLVEIVKLNSKPCMNNQGRYRAARAAKKC